ncbi:MAG: deoxyribonuclease V [Anaerolineae bacterium]|nr:deoxyribonuclease V [Anaerolineae bacterium]
MKFSLDCLHSWNLEPNQAVALQQSLRGRVRAEPFWDDVASIGGVDVGILNGMGRAAVVRLDYVSLQPLEVAVATEQISFPYIPGLLSFREMPVILKALEKLSGLPDVFIVDGHGIAHPRRFGIASHLGVILDKPTIGCAKSILVGSYQYLAEEVGSQADLVAEGEVVGVALRTRRGCKPVIVSVGHRVDLLSAVRLIMTTVRGYRLPEPCRLAHRFASRVSQHYDKDIKIK